MVYAFLPFMSAALYGLGYILIEKMLKGVPVLAYMVVNSLLFSIILVTIYLFRREQTSFEFLSDKKALALFLLTLAVNATAWVITLLSLKNNNATYTAFAEISYPLFTVLFLFIVFGVAQEWTWQSVLGSVLIFGGSVLLVFSHVSHGNS
jgi:drug/metabolite transporter (DMT)-like permease